jgi:hypothetical protein
MISEKQCTVAEHQVAWVKKCKSLKLVRESPSFLRLYSFKDQVKRLSHHRLPRISRQPFPNWKKKG